MVSEPSNGPPLDPFLLSPLPPEPTKGAFLTPEAFDSLDEDTIIIPVRRFCRDLANENMESLREAQIGGATCWKRGVHEFLLFSILIAPHAPHAQSRRVWMKIERHPKERPTLSSPSRPFPAVDSVSLSAEHDSLKQANDEEVMRCIFKDLQLKHVTDLLGIIEDICPEYVLASYNCWFHATVILGSLQNFGRVWTKKPQRDLVKSLVGALSEPATREITQKFHHRWPPKSSVPFISLTSVEVWGGTPLPRRVDTLEPVTRRPSLHSPQSLLDTSGASPSTLPLILPSIISVLPLDDNEDSLRETISKHLIQGDDSHDREAFLAVYPLFTTNEQLFRTLQQMFEDPSCSSDERTQPWILRIVLKWVHSDHFSSKMTEDVENFIKTDVDSNARFSGSPNAHDILSKLRDISSKASDSSLAPTLLWNPSDLTPRVAPIQPPLRKAFLSRLTSDSSEKIPNASHVGDISKKHIPGLARALVQIEIQSRLKITIPKIVQRLVWERKGTNRDSDPFSELSLHIQIWVFYSVLRKGLQDRVDAYHKLVYLAEECVKMQNYATATDLVVALQSKSIQNLKLTMKRASKDTHKLQGVIEAIDSANWPTPGMIESWASIMRRLQDSLNTVRGQLSANDDQRSTFWPGFRNFHSTLAEAVKPLPSQSNDPESTSWTKFLSRQFDEGKGKWDRREMRETFAQNLAAGEEEEVYKEQRRNEGF